MRRTVCSVVFLLVVACVPMDHASDLNVSLAPARSSYRVSEPIDLVLSLKNNRPTMLSVSFEYPGRVGLSFTCADEGAVASSAWDFGGRVPALSLIGGEKLTRAVALDRYVRFKAPRRYSVGFIAEYMEPVSDANPKPATFTARGQFVVNVLAGPPDPKRLEAYAKDLAGDDSVAREEAAEMLLWWDDPAAIEPLRLAAKRVPDAAPDVVRALGKFFGDERARTAILDVARDGSAESLRVALEVYETKKGPIPVEFFRAILNSHYSGKMYPTLLYLKDHGDLRHLALVQPFEDDANPEISKLATEVVAKVTKRQP